MFELFSRGLHNVDPSLAPYAFAVHTNPLSFPDRHCLFPPSFHPPQQHFPRENCQSQYLQRCSFAAQPAISTTGKKFKPPSPNVSEIPNIFLSYKSLIPIHCSNEPRYTCKIPYTPMSLNYTLGASLSRSAIGALVVSAQRYVQVQLNLGHGSDRIHYTLPGRFWLFKADLVLYASDFGSGDALTWSELFQAIDLVRYCGFERRIYLEMFADVYVRFARVGHIVVKLARSPSLGGDSLVTE